MDKSIRIFRNVITGSEMKNLVGTTTTTNNTVQLKQKRSSRTTQLLLSLSAGIFAASMSTIAIAEDTKAKLKTPDQVEEALSSLLASRDETVKNSVAKQVPTGTKATQKTDAAKTENKSTESETEKKKVDHSDKSVAELILAGLAITNEAKNELKEGGADKTGATSSTESTADVAPASTSTNEEDVLPVLPAPALSSTDESQSGTTVTSEQLVESAVTEGANGAEEVLTVSETTTEGTVDVVYTSEEPNNVAETLSVATLASETEAIAEDTAEDTAESEAEKAAKKAAEARAIEERKAIEAKAKEEALAKEALAKQEALAKAEELAKQEELAKAEALAKQEELAKAEALVKQEELAKAEALAKQEELAKAEELAKQQELPKLPPVQESTELQVEEATVVISDNEVIVEEVVVEEVVVEEVIEETVTEVASESAETVSNSASAPMVKDQLKANVELSVRAEGCPEKFNQIDIPINGKLCQIFAADFPASMILFVPQSPEEVVEYYLSSSVNFIEPKVIKQRTMMKSADNNATLIISKDGGGTQVDILVKEPII